MARILRGPKGKHNEIDYGSLGKYFYDKAQIYANNIFQIDADLEKQETYAEASTRAIRLALSLRDLGLEQDDIIMVISKNTINNCIPLIAGWYSGAIFTSIDPAFSLADFKHCISLTKPKFIFTEHDCLNLVKESVSLLDCTSQIVVFEKSESHLNFDDLTSKEHEGETNFKLVVVSSKKTVLILFSSGSTGFPKGICINHDGILKATLNTLDMDFLKADVIFTFTTLYGVSAIWCLLWTIITGGHRVLTCQTQDMERILDIFQKFKVTTVLISPTITYKFLEAQKVKKYELESLYALLVGGSGIHFKQIHELRKNFKNTKVQFNYGMTENSTFITLFDFTRDKNIYLKKESCGKPNVDTEIKIVDIETRKLLPAYEKGEVCIKSLTFANGYHNMDMSSEFDDEGFLKTGDVGYYDEDDCIYLVDRVKEMFKFRSLHIVPAYIEGVLLKHPAVKEAVVVGVPHGFEGDAPGAMVVLKKDSDVGVDEIIKFVDERVGDYQRLRGGVRIVQDIPKTASAKYKRNAIRDMFQTL